MKRGIAKQDDDSNNNGKKPLRRQRSQIADEDDAHIIGTIVPGGSSRPAVAASQDTGGIHSIETLGENIHLPDYVREHSSTLTFPEKLMLTLTHVDRERRKSGIPESGESIGWVLDGTAFAVQKIDKFCATWLPMFFGQSKFSSFTRKLYRWGFRKINVASIPNGSSYGDNALFFGNEHFLRSEKSRLSLMKSVTAAKIRSGALGIANNKARLAQEQSESEADESKPPAVVGVASISNNQPHYFNRVETSGADVASLIQQSANLSTLLSLLASNPQAVLALNQSLQLPNVQIAPIIHQSSMASIQIPTIPQLNVDQMLQQLAVSTALLNASGAIPSMPQNVPWWITNGIQAPPVQQQQSLHGWMNRPILNVPQPLTQNSADVDRLRNVLGAFLRYSNSVQQQTVNSALLQQQQQQQQQQGQNLGDDSQPPNHPSSQDDKPP